MNYTVPVNTFALTVISILFIFEIIVQAVCLLKMLLTFIDGAKQDIADFVMMFSIFGCMLAEVICII